MKTVLLILALLSSHVLSAEVFKARITYYTDCPRYGKITASGKRATQGITVAADRNFKFGQKLYIPDLRKMVGGNGTFEVQDRGAWVQSKKASNGKLPIIDVYVSSRAQLLKLKKNKNNIVLIQKK